MSLPKEIQIPSLHSDSMIRDEARAMLGKTDFFITAGGVMELWLIGSPFLSGDIDALTAQDLRAARVVLNAPHLQPETLINALNTAFRPFEIIEAKPNPRHAKSADYSGICPEWLADLYLAVADHTGISYNDFLHKIPFCAIAHIYAAAHRYNGGTTARPLDWTGITSQINTND